MQIENTGDSLVGGKTLDLASVPSLATHQPCCPPWTAGLSGLGFAIGLWKPFHLEIFLTSAACQIFCT